MKLGKLRVVERRARRRYRFINCRRVNGRKTADTDMGSAFVNVGIDQDETAGGEKGWREKRRNLRGYDKINIFCSVRCRYGFRLFFFSASINEQPAPSTVLRLRKRATIFFDLTGCKLLHVSEIRRSALELQALVVRGNCSFCDGGPFVAAIVCSVALGC